MHSPYCCISLDHSYRPIFVFERYSPYFSPYLSNLTCDSTEMPFVDRNIMCGTLQCQLGMQHPVTPNMDQSYSRTIVAMGGQEYECKCVEIISLFCILRIFLFVLLFCVVDIRWDLYLWDSLVVSVVFCDFYFLVVIVFYLSYVIFILGNDVNCVDLWVTFLPTFSFP